MKWCHYCGRIEQPDIPIVDTNVRRYPGQTFGGKQYVDLQMCYQCEIEGISIFSPTPFMYSAFVSSRPSEWDKQRSQAKDCKNRAFLEKCFTQPSVHPRYGS